ncbi:DUF5107 domain-containing protein [Bacillus sp. Marseille-Q3570]|uniref:aldose epimerase family protein n=1 Tax=Bacillus sp. Marseille-Q3570 TaxID=2963522 RepID=UPI0021B76545|nr:DUF5107 domain-containing protein [Bacillus sp. Marseille-Q3570]
MIRRSTFKGIDSIILENDQLRATILPGYGGKMASFYDKEAGYEWLFQSKAEQLRIPPYGADYAAYDSSGFDEIFPGIDQGPHPNDLQMIPDHGEVWTLPWNVTERAYGLDLQVKSRVFPYRLFKKIRLEPDGVELRYEALNDSNEDFPFIWTAHSLLNMNQSTTIALPDGLGEIMTVEHGSKHLGEWGTIHPYPLTSSKKTDQPIDLSRFDPLESDNMEKFYFTGSLKEGWCRVVHEDIGRSLTYRYPPDKVPYLGIWKTEGGYRGEYNFALEPCTGVYDDVYVANKIDKVSKIPANGSYSWTFTMEIG